MIIEPATLDDLPTITAMREEASAWLRERGIDQWREPWPTYDAMVERTAASIRAGETWMARDDSGATTATVALDTFADSRLWTPQEQQDPALYLHRLIVRRGWAGLGSKILDWACDRAAQLGKEWVRIDVWTHNEPLHRYYLSNGFEHVRTLNLEDYPSGALFQRQANGDHSQR
ncbi:N-acetyltransferase family protein [Planosporangium sp. 12N6]|uniref:GNAT family N-acetyltransferase n=1 Tax=Planosporangium spinosum TaxID=3402278 RepID=UPI003CF7A36E